MPSNKVTAIFIAIVVLLAFLLVMAILNTTVHAEMSGQECSEVVNSIFEADQAGRLNPPLTQMQVLELNNACDSEWITLDDIKEMAPQYWNPGETDE